MILLKNVLFSYWPKLNSILSFIKKFKGFGWQYKSGTKNVITYLNIIVFVCIKISFPSCYWNLYQSIFFMFQYSSRCSISCFYHLIVKQTTYKSVTLCDVDRNFANYYLFLIIVNCYHFMLHNSQTYTYICII